jgi:hypothetical protein
MQSLSQLIAAMRAHGATRFFAKRLAPNDNSKNQFYLGEGFSSLSLLPHGEIVTDDSEQAGSIRDRAKAPVDLYWIDDQGTSRAPNAQLILYPKYPEVRLSGLIHGCARAPSDVLAVRDEGRVLMFGTGAGEMVWAFAAAAAHPIAKEVTAIRDAEMIGVFVLVGLSPANTTSKNQLAARLAEIHQLGWVQSQKLGSNGVPEPYSARNGGGYTLEALLGISPNGRAEPDFLGWEIKQYSVDSFAQGRAKSPITLMTPEPQAGFYKTQGAAAFIRRFGYPDMHGRADRINFGGIYRCDGPSHRETKLGLKVRGFDTENNKIEDMAGDIALLTLDGEAAASWPFTTLVEHWTGKHTRAAYVPSLFQPTPPSYAFGSRISFCEGTDFHLFLKAMIAGAVWYDPGLKIEKASGNAPIVKRRSQFRTKHRDLERLYVSREDVDVVPRGRAT